MAARRLCGRRRDLAAARGERRCRRRSSISARPIGSAAECRSILPRPRAGSSARRTAAISMPQTTLGLLLFQNGDQASGLKWLKQAADQGEPRAQLVYGTALYNGDSVTQDRCSATPMSAAPRRRVWLRRKETLAQLDELMPPATGRAGACDAQPMRQRSAARKTAPKPPKPAEARRRRKPPKAAAHKPAEQAAAKPTAAPAAAATRRLAHPARRLLAARRGRSALSPNFRQSRARRPQALLCRRRHGHPAAGRPVSRAEAAAAAACCFAGHRLLRGPGEVAQRLNQSRRRTPCTHSNASRP